MDGPVTKKKLETYILNVQSDCHYNPVPARLPDHFNYERDKLDDQTQMVTHFLDLHVTRQRVVTVVLMLSDPHSRFSWTMFLDKLFLRSLPMQLLDVLVDLVYWIQGSNILYVDRQKVCHKQDWVITNRSLTF